MLPDDVFVGSPPLAFTFGLGGLAIFPLFPRVGQPATRILVQGVKGSRAPLSLLSGLVLHDEAGGFMPGPDAILRTGSALKVMV